MSIPHLTLDTNKNLKRMVRVAVRQTEKGGLIEASFLDADSRPYDLTNLHVTFNDRKANNKFLSDSNVTIVDARNGSIKYTLHDQTYAGSGTAWFDISDASGSKVDSTQSFKIEVDDAFNVNIYNSEYVRSLELLRDKMQALVDAAKKLEDDQTNKFTHDLSANLSNAQNQLNNKLTSMQSAYDSAEKQRSDAFNNDQVQRTNTYNTDRANRDNDYKTDKARIDQDWVNDKARIDKEWQDDKSRIDQEASTQYTSIQSQADKQSKDIQSRADSQNSSIQDRADSQNHSIQNRADKQNSTISAAWKKQTDDIDAAWVAQKAFLDNAVNSINTTLDTIRSDIDTLSKTSLPAMDQKATSVQEKIDKLRADMSAIDFSSYAKKSDVAVAIEAPFPTDITDLDALPEGRYNLRNLTEDQWQQIKNIPPIDHYGMIICYKEDGDGWQLAYSTNNPTIIFFRGAGGGKYIDWQQLKQPTTSYTNQDIDTKIANAGQVKQVSGVGPDGSGNVPLDVVAINGYDIASKNPVKQKWPVTQAWYVDQQALQPFADAINNLQGTGGNTVSDKVDLNTLNTRGNAISSYILRNDQNINTPSFYQDKRGTLIVLNWDTNAITQLFFPVIDSSGFAWRTHLSGKWSDWKQGINQGIIDSKINNIKNLNPDAFNRAPLFTGDANDIDRTGVFANANTIKNLPTGSYGTLVSFVSLAGNLDERTQFYMPDNDNNLYWRNKRVDGNAPWEPWRILATNDTLNSKVNVNGNLFTTISQSNNWSDIFPGYNGNQPRLVSFRDESQSGTALGNFAAGIGFGGGDTKGALNIAYSDHTARIIGGNGTSPVWHEDIAWKSDITNLNSRMNSLDHDLTQRVGALESKIPDIHTVSSEAEGNTYLASHPNAIIFVKG